jgi:ABC-2 type transport system ATP-binding protein
MHGLMPGRLAVATMVGMTERDVVTVRGLRKTYRGRVVVDGLDLDVPAGEIVGLAGANGAGKTTAVECIQGLRKPDAGVLRVLGFDPATQADQLRPLLGSQLQDSALPDRLRVTEALDLFATSRADDRGELLTQFGLAERRRSVFSSLSGGERQRLFLVLALLNRPRLVILDELTQGLDPAARRNEWAAVRQLRAAGTTVLLVTHEMDEAEALCARIVVMRAGRVLDAGTPAELVGRHARRATVSFSLPGAPASLLDQIGRLDGVRDVQWAGAQIAVHGDRRIIAYVGAALVQHGPVPGNLSAHVPNLEDALLRLLEPEPGAADPGPAAPGSAASGSAASGSAAPTAASHDLIGGRR